MNIDVRGYSNGSELYYSTVVVDTTGSIWFDFNFYGIDMLQFVSYGGDDGRSHFVMDNLVYNELSPIPEPSSLLLLITGLAGLMFNIRQKKTKISI